MKRVAAAIGSVERPNRHALLSPKCSDRKERRSFKKIGARLISRVDAEPIPHRSTFLQHRRGPRAVGRSHSATGPIETIRICELADARGQEDLPVLFLFYDPSDRLFSVLNIWAKKRLRNEEDGL